MGGFGDTLTFFGTGPTTNTDTKAKDGNDSSRSSSPAKRVRFDDSSSDEEKYENVHKPRHKARDTSNIIVPGGRAAAPKPIKADYDEDDACIVKYKQQGYTDEWVAKKLAEEGRVRYVARTVGSRWQRLKKAFVEKEEELLDDDLSDWHVGEDDLLERAVNAIDEKTEKEIAKLQAKKWRDVADHFAQLIQRRKYTPRACRERFESLATDNYLVPIELDDDQEGRRIMREERINAARQRRFDAAMAEKEAEEEKRRVREAKKVAQTVAVDKRIDHAEVRRKEKEARQRVKEIAEQARLTSRNNANQWLLYNRLEAKWTSDRTKAEIACLNKLLGLNVNARPTYLSQALVVDSSDEEAMSDRVTDDEEMPNLFEDPDDDAMSPDGDSEKEVTTTKQTQSSKSKALNRTMVIGNGKPSPAKKARLSATPIIATTPSRTGTPSKPATPKSTVIQIGTAKVTAETLTNARSVMTRAELEIRIFERKHTGILKPVEGESHAQIIARMDAEDNRLTKDRLREILRSRLLHLDGTKREWIARLQENDAEDSTAGANGVKATDEGFKKQYEGYNELA